MSIPLILIAFATLTWMLAQFGGRVAARSATIWWLVAGLMLLAAAAPQALRPIADALGIEFVSNLVLASLIVFLLYQNMEHLADSTQTARRLRRLGSRLAAASFIERRPNVPRSDRPRVLVILPCFQEEASLPGTLAAMAAVTAEDMDIDWCVVNDGSTDQTESILRTQAPDHHTSHLANAGVAGVLVTGFEIARALHVDYVVQCDADGQHPFDRIPELVRAAQEHQADLLIGSRYSATRQTDDSSTPLRRAGGWVLSAALRVFGNGVRVSDPTSGFRAYSSRAMQHLLHGMPDEYPEPESIAVLSLVGLKIAEHPVRMMPRVAGQSSIAPIGAVRYMMKVITAIIGLRLRKLMRSSP
jgi:hypothetical protein